MADDVNIFDKKQKTTKSKKVEFPKIHPKNMEQNELFKLIKKYEKTDTKTKKLTAKINFMKETLRKLALNEYLSKYEEDQKNPGSILIEAIDEDTEDVGQYLFVPQDRYITIKTESDADKLEKKYGKGLIERNQIFSIEPKMFKKYYKVISKLIAESEDIEQEDKGKLFTSTETYSIISGTIDKLNEFDSFNIEKLFEEIKPVVSVKNAEIIKS